MGTRRDLVSEIEEIRSRGDVSGWDNGITKLLFLVDQTRNLEQEREEHGYFLVASVSAIETYFRWEIQRLVDSGDARYISRLRLDDSTLKISHDLLVAVHGKRVSIGELIARSVRLHSLDAINKTMGQLLGADLLELVKDARSPELRREQKENAPRIIDSIGETLERVKRTFELRHIICHEAHLDMVFQVDEVRSLCSACYGFVLASHYGIEFHRNPDAPLTLAEAYEAASQRVKVLDNEINGVEQQIISKMHSEMAAGFNAIQEAWRIYVRREAEFNSSPSVNMNGNRGQLYFQLAIESCYGKRLLELKEYARKIDKRPWKA